MAESENGTIYFSAVTPMSGDLTIHNKSYTAKAIEEGLSRGTLYMQADHCDDFMITVRETGEEIATVGNYDAMKGYLTSYDFIPLD